MPFPRRLSILTSWAALAFAWGAAPPVRAEAARATVTARARAKLSPEQKERLAAAVVPALATTRGPFKGSVRDARDHRLEVRTRGTPAIEGATTLADGAFAFVLQFEHGLGAGGFVAVVDDADAGARLVASERWPGAGVPRGTFREAVFGGERALLETDRSEGSGSVDTTRVWVLRGHRLVLLGSLESAVTVLDVRDPTGAGRALVATMDATLETDGDALVAHEKWVLWEIGDAGGQRRRQTVQRDVTYVRKGDTLRRVGPIKAPWG